MATLGIRTPSFAPSSVWDSIVIDLLTAFPINALMCIKNFNLLHRDLRPILMLLHILLYIVLACIILFAALLNSASMMPIFSSLTFENAFRYHALPRVIVT